MAARWWQCLACGCLAGSAAELRLHWIRHGAADVAAYLGRPDLAAGGSWCRTLREAVRDLVREGAVAGLEIGAGASAPAALADGRPAPGLRAYDFTPGMRAGRLADGRREVGGVAAC